MLYTAMVHYKQSKVRSYIEEHLTEPMKMGDLYEIAKMGHTYFNRLFKVTFGVTPGDYVLKRRIDFACELMRTTSFPNYRIAIECGFTDGTYFARRFRKIMGVGPMEWRKENGYVV